MYINPLSRIRNTSLISAYYGLDSRECKCLEYYIIILKYVCVIESPKNILPLTLYPRRDSKGISGIPPKRPRFTRMT
jgi:hypothetical protein